jgi:plasmid stabilization system protein ParE
MEQFLIEIYDEDFETLIDDYFTCENEEQAREYAKSLERFVKTDNYTISIRNVKDI